jgi:hypothetical protein
MSGDLNTDSSASEALAKLQMALQSCPGRLWAIAPPLLPGPSLWLLALPAELGDDGSGYPL